MSIARCFVAVALLAILEACSTVPDNASVASSSTFTAIAPAVVSTAPGTGGEYRLSPGDILDITVFQVPDLTKQVQVDAAGMISLPLIGEVKAGGGTTHSLETDIAAKLKAKYLQSPQVSIFLRNATGNQVTVDGEVKTPGVFPIMGNMTLIQALARSGGLAEVGDPSSVLIFRQSNNTRMVAKFNLDDIRSGRTVDPSLYGGDTVVVDSSGSRSLWKGVREALPAAGLFAPLVL